MNDTLMKIAPGVTIDLDALLHTLPDVFQHGEVLRFFLRTGLRDYPLKEVAVLRSDLTPDAQARFGML